MEAETVLPTFEIEERAQEATPKETVPVRVSEAVGEVERNDELADPKVDEAPAYIEDDTVIISHDDAKPEDVAQAEAAVKVSSPIEDVKIEDATITIGAFLDGPAESLPSPATGVGSNVSDAGDRESDVPVMDQEDVPAETEAAVTEDISRRSYDTVDVSDFEIPPPSDSPIHLEIKGINLVLEPAHSVEPSLSAFNVDGAAQEEDVKDIIEAAEELKTTSEVTFKADIPITGELVYLRSPFEEISNKITAEDDPKSPGVALEEPTEEMTNEESSPVQATVESGFFVDKPAGEITTLSDSDPTASIITASVLGGAAVIGAAAIIAYSSDGKPSPSAAVDNELRSKSVAEDVKEPTVSMQVNEEFIMEPAPQTAPSLVHGVVVPEVDAKQALEDANTVEAPVIVVSSPPASPIVGTSEEAEERTVEIIRTTPGAWTQHEVERESGEIFSHPVWNQSITPFLHFSLENTVKQRMLGGSMAGSRPVSSGNDTVSTKHQKNMMRVFWNVIFFGWLGGFGRILSGMFGKSKKAQRNAN